jgi:ribonuclease D
MVGIDTEWKPYFGTERNEMSLVQIATRERVCILDVCTLGCQCAALWHELGSILFANENIVKLGKLTPPLSTLAMLCSADYIHNVKSVIPVYFCVQIAAVLSDLFYHL